MNALEDILRRAAAEPSCRPEFCRVFLESKIIVPHGNTPDEMKIEDGRLVTGVQLKLPSIMAEGHAWVPVFSSVEKLAKGIAQVTPYIQLAGRDFLEIVRGSFVLLNPGSDYAKQFLPDEIDAMISGAVFRPDSGRRIVTTKPEQVLLGQPAQYPFNLVAVLKDALPRYPSVKAAYLAHCFFPSQGVTPHTVIGLDASAYDNVVGQIGPIAQSALGKDEIVDFVQIAEGNAIADYMVKETKPFYTAANRGFWKRVFG